MIVKGFAISRGSTHATHLMRTDENEHVALHEVRGFVASDVHGAFKEAQAVARGTKCKQHLFSCVFSPPDSARLSTVQFIHAIDKTEEALGLGGQPRVVVFHEKEGRPHAHCVWSRIDADTMKARQLSHWKVKLGDVSRALHQEFGIEMPRGLKNKQERDPLNFSQAEWQMAKRNGENPQWLKGTVQECWKRSDNRASFEKALGEHSLFLAKGDRRGIVVVDLNGYAQPVSRLLGGKTKDVRAKLGDAPIERSVAEVQKLLAERKTATVLARVESSRVRFLKRQTALRAVGTEMTHLHRDERAKVSGIQAAQWARSTLERQARLPRGLRGLWSWVTGETARIKANNENEARAQAARHAREREELAARQREERRVLQEKIKGLRKEQARELLALRRELAPHLQITRISGPRQDVLAARLGLKLER
jgi:hypothetical protein